MALTPELKAVRAIKEMCNQKDYGRYHFADLLLADGNVNDAVAMAAAIVELAAVKADYGDFDKDTREWTMVARALRNSLLDHVGKG